MINVTHQDLCHLSWLLWDPRIQVLNALREGSTIHLCSVMEHRTSPDNPANLFWLI